MAKKSEKCEEHQSLHYHEASMELADELKLRIEQPQVALPALIDKGKVANSERNRANLKSLAQVVLFCGKQCITLQGSSEH